MSTLVKFVGGPFDGYSQTIERSQNELELVLYLPISDALLKAIAGDDPGEVHDITHLAAYKLQIKGSESIYRFSNRTEPGDSKDWMPWIHKMVEAYRDYNEKRRR